MLASNPKNPQPSPTPESPAGSPSTGSPVGGSVTPILSPPPPVVIGGTTIPISQLVPLLTPGAQPITTNGVVVSLGSHSAVIVVGSQTIPTPSPVVIGGITVPIPQPTPLPTAGEPITTNGIVISLGPSSVIVVGSQTIPPSLSPTPGPPAVVIGGTTIPVSQLASGFSFLPSGSGILLPNGQTLTPGGITTVNGIPISLAPSEAEVVFAGSTVPITGKPSGGLGSYIYSGIGGFVPPPSSTPAQFTGGAAGGRVRDKQVGALWVSSLGLYLPG